MNIISSAVLAAKMYISPLFQVKTERMHSGQLKPVRVDHVDIATSFVERKQGFIGTWSRFAVVLISDAIDYSTPYMCFRRTAIFITYNASLNSSHGVMNMWIVDTSFGS